MKRTYNDRQMRAASAPSVRRKAPNDEQVSRKQPPSAPKKAAQKPKGEK